MRPTRFARWLFSALLAMLFVVFAVPIAAHAQLQAPPTTVQIAIAGIPIPGFVVNMLMPAIVGTIAATLAVWLHSAWSRGESWYANRGPTIQVALGTVVALLLTAFGATIPQLGSATSVCSAGGGGALSKDCLDAIGALFTKDNIAYVITAIITIGGHINAKAHEQLQLTRAMARRAGIAAPQ